MRVVLDTNVVVSTYLSSRGTIVTLLRAWEDQRFDVVVSAPILEEYREVLNRPHLAALHGKSVEEIDVDIGRISSSALLVEPGEAIHAITRDPDDNEFLECAVAGEAQVIVTGDPHLLDLGSYQGIQILTPAGFVVLLSQAE